MPHGTYFHDLVDLPDGRVVEVRQDPDNDGWIGLWWDSEADRLLDAQEGHDRRASIIIAVGSRELLAQEIGHGATVRKLHPDHITFDLGGQ